jgi:hypothetical protein
MANMKITVSDTATNVDVGFETDQLPGGYYRRELTVHIDQQMVEVTDEQFRQLVDALMDVRAVLAEVKKQVQP